MREKLASESIAEPLAASHSPTVSVTVRRWTRNPAGLCPHGAEESPQGVLPRNRRTCCVGTQATQLSRSRRFRRGSEAGATGGHLAKGCIPFWGGGQTSISFQRRPPRQMMCAPKSRLGSVRTRCDNLELATKGWSYQESPISFKFFFEVHEKLKARAQLKDCEAA